jgi:hypothetical protein
LASGGVVWGTCSAIAALTAGRVFHEEVIVIARCVVFVVLYGAVVGETHDVVLQT